MTFVTPLGHIEFFGPNLQSVPWRLFLDRPGRTASSLAPTGSRAWRINKNARSPSRELGSADPKTELLTGLLLNFDATYGVCRGTQRVQQARSAACARQFLQVLPCSSARLSSRGRVEAKATKCKPLDWSCIRRASPRVSYGGDPIFPNSRGESIERGPAGRSESVLDPPMGGKVPGCRTIPAGRKLQG